MKFRNDAERDLWSRVYASNSAQQSSAKKIAAIADEAVELMRERENRDPLPDSGLGVLSPESSAQLAKTLALKGGY